MTNAQLETKLRNSFMECVAKAIEEQYDADVLRVGASEFAIPCVDAENNDRFVLIRVSIPRGTRNGEGGYDPYDGYAIAEDYAQDQQEKAEKKADAEAKKRAKIAKDQKAREQKQALAEANKNLKELRKIKLEGAKKNEGVLD